MTVTARTDDADLTISVATTNEEGQTKSLAYDGLGRLVSVSGLDGAATYTYDEAGNLLTQTDALGRVTSDTGLAETLAARGRAHVLDRHDARRAAAILESALLDLLAAPPGPRPGNGGPGAAN